ncbi:MAG: peptide-methionine (S)-S-oxide reductase MsrA [Acidimicrobiaceae bacterium]|nr:peptide-methionine (S)-S-oxide reductase MsrA [Acidimicrobiaceae bacterium]
MNSSPVMIEPDHALKGRSEVVNVQRPHLVYGVSMMEAVPPDAQVAYVAMGCFWGAERKFFELDGVINTSVGYQGGFTPNPSYEEVCTGKTGHAESVKVVFDPSKVSYRQVLACFYENHNPTQGFRQGADIGTQYRSAIYYVDDVQRATAHEVTAIYAAMLASRGYATITTEIAPAGPFYLAEEYHQQYLVANPNGYCGLGGTGVSCPVGLA